MQILSSRWLELEGDGKTGPLVLVDKIPKMTEFVFRKEDDCYVAEKDGIVKIFIHRPGSFDGMHGAKLVLNTGKGKELTFNGSLWLPSNTLQIPKKYRDLHRIYLSENRDEYERGYPMQGEYVTESLYFLATGMTQKGGQIV